MTSVSLAVRAIGATRFRIGVRADTAALVGLSALIATLVGLGWGTWGDVGRDTGYDLVAGARVAHGAVPYAGFVYYYGPLAPGLLGLAAWLWGAGLAPALGVGLALTVAIVLATYALGRTWLSPAGSALAAAITAAVALEPTNFSFVLPHTYAAPLAVLTTLLFLISLARFAARGNRMWLLAGGFSAGLVALTKVEFEAAVLLALVAWLVLRARAGLGNIREAALLAGPALLVPAAVYGGFLTVVSPHRLFLHNLYPVDQFRIAGNAVLRIHAPLTASSFLQLGARLILYAAGIGLMLGLGLALERARRRRYLAWGCVTAGVACAVAAAAAKPETLRYYLEFVYGWIPAGAALAVVYLLWRFFRRRSLWRPQDEVELAGAVVLSVLAAETYAGFFMQTTRAQPAVYAIPFAALFLARLHLGRLAVSRSVLVLGGIWLVFLTVAAVGLTLKDVRTESATVRGPGGAVSAKPADAALYNAALSWIARETKPGEPILLAPQLTALYTLSGRQDPLPEISLLPGALPTPRSEQAAIRRLERERVRLFITDRRRFSEYGQSTFGASFDRILAGWIRQHAAHLATLASPAGAQSHTLDIWLRSIPS